MVKSLTSLSQLADNFLKEKTKLKTIKRVLQTMCRDKCKEMITRIM